MRPLKITLTPKALARLTRPVSGKGGFQSLLRKLQRQIEGVVLTVYPEDVERLIRYSFEYGRGGFQERTKSPIA
jgi:hypothetical protein